MAIHRSATLLTISPRRLINHGTVMVTPHRADHLQTKLDRLLPTPQTDTRRIINTTNRRIRTQSLLLVAIPGTKQPTLLNTATRRVLGLLLLGIRRAIRPRHNSIRRSNNTTSSKLHTHNITLRISTLNIRRPHHLRSITNHNSALDLRT